MQFVTLVFENVFLKLLSTSPADLRDTRVT